MMSNIEKYKYVQHYLFRQGGRGGGWMGVEHTFIKSFLSPICLMQEMLLFAHFFQ